MKKLRVILLLFMAGTVWAQTGKITGLVIDEASQQVLVGVNVSLPELKAGNVTNDKGEFEIINLPVGIYKIEFSYIGYGKRIVTNVVIKSSKTARVNIALKQEALQGEEVTITAGYFVKPDDSPVSVQKLSYEEIRRAPGARGDISRMLQTLAGVSPSSDDRNDLIIRGGSPSEVLFMIDHIDIPNPNHFGTQGATGGPISMINTELIEDVKFLAGGFSARYGHKLSGVMDVKFREGSRERTGGMADLNMAGIGGHVEGPLFQGKGSYIFSLHRSYMELMAPLLGYGGIPVYSNLQGKLVVDLNAKNQLLALVLGGDDSIDFGGKAEADDYHQGQVDTLGYEKTDFRSRQITTGMRLRTLWNRNIFSYFTVSHSYSRFYTDYNNESIAARLDSKNKIKDEEVISSTDVYDNVSTESMSIVKGDFSWLLPGRNELNFGAYLRMYKFNHDIKFIPENPDEKNAYGVRQKALKVNYRQPLTPKTGGYLSLKLTPLPGLMLNAGFRYDYFSLLKEADISPRLNAALKINSRLSFNAGGGRYYQDPEFIHISGDRTNKYNLKTIGADHLIAGLEYLLAEDMRLTVEAYHKRYFNYPVMADSNYQMITMANNGATYGNTGSNLLISTGTGKVSGIEAMIQKKVTKNIYGLISYSLSRIEHKAGDGIFRAGTFDSRNVFNLVLGYRLNKSWEFSMKWRYAGGTPYTPYDVISSTAAGRGLLDLNEVNSNRFRPYHRLDLRFDHRSYFKKVTIVSYFSIENVYNRQNQLTTYWDALNDSMRFRKQMGLFPIGGVSVEF